MHAVQLSNVLHSRLKRENTMAMYKKSSSTRKSGGSSAGMKKRGTYGSKMKKSTKNAR